VGFDSRQTLGEKETGAKAALPIWMAWMRAAISGKDDEKFLADTTANPAPKASPQPPPIQEQPAEQPGHPRRRQRPAHPPGRSQRRPTRQPGSPLNPLPNPQRGKQRSLPQPTL